MLPWLQPAMHPHDPRELDSNNVGCCLTGLLQWRNHSSWQTTQWFYIRSFASFPSLNGSRDCWIIIVIVNECQLILDGKKNSIIVFRYLNYIWYTNYCLWEPNLWDREKSVVYGLSFYKNTFKDRYEVFLSIVVKWCTSFFLQWNFARLTMRNWRKHSRQAIIWERPFSILAKLKSWYKRDPFSKNSPW